MADRAYLERLTRELADQGKLIEAGWVGLRLVAMDPASPPDQLREMRMAFFAGAQHLFHSIMGILDPGEEPTEPDVTRMDLIDKELRTFIKEFELRYTPTKGKA